MASIFHARQLRPLWAATGGARLALSRRFACGVAIVGLGLALALGGCGPSATHQNNGAAVSGQQTQSAGSNTSAPATTGSSSAAQQVQNLDQQTQNDTSSLDN